MWAQGERAWGICDICGERVKRNEMAPIVIKGKTIGVLACPSCWSEDHPQNWVGINMPPTRIAIRNPRPETALDSAWAFPPVPFETYSKLQGVSPR